jgi:hypothetical protein
VLQTEVVALVLVSTQVLLGNVCQIDPVLEEEDIPCFQETFSVGEGFLLGVNITFALCTDFQPDLFNTLFLSLFF